MPDPLPMSPDAIPTEITKLAYTAPGPNLSQNAVATLLAHYWPAIEQHFRTLLADEIDTTSKALLDDLPEDEVRPSDWDQHEEWLAAADSIRRPAAAAVLASAPEAQQ